MAAVLKYGRLQSSCRAVMTAYTLTIRYVSENHGGALIAAFDPDTGALPPGDHRATPDEISQRPGFTPRRRRLLKGLRAAVKAFWGAGIEEIYIDGSVCTEKPDPGDIDGLLGRTRPASVRPHRSLLGRFRDILVPHLRQWKWRMRVEHGVEFFIHPAMQANREVGFPEFFRRSRDGSPRGVIQVVRAGRS
jgi:hypothetical protein